MKRMIRLGLICCAFMIFLFNSVVFSKSKESGYVFKNMTPMNHKTVVKEIDKIKKNKLSCPDIQVTEIGKSVEGNSISLIKIQSVPAQRTTVNMMVIGRQHGNEPAGTSAIFSYISDLINGNRQLPNNVTLFVVPMVNPDGSNNNTRNNVNNINLNRDWEQVSQPEVRVVYNAFKKYNPEIFLDLHEFSSFKGRDFDMTYCPGIDRKSPAALQELYAAFEKIVDEKLAGTLCDKTEARTVGWIPGNPVMAANQMGLKRLAISYIVETKGIPANNPLPPLAERVKMHRIFMETMIAYASENQDLIINTISKLRMANPVVEDSYAVLWGVHEKIFN